MMKDLKSLDKEELEEFFNSFDKILCDVHGVLWNVLDTIPGAGEAITAFRKINKRFIVVSNNTTTTLDNYHQSFKKAGFDIDRDNIVTPILTTISFLKDKNFDKEIYVLGTVPLKQSLADAGFQIAEPAPREIPETFNALAAASTEDDGSVGAVLMDIDLNVNYPSLQKAATFLKRPDVIFIRGTGDTKFTLGLDRIIMGPGVFHDILEFMSERKPAMMAKPGPIINEYIVKKYEIDDPGRVLFIGDSVPSDMGFATDFGYKKLLVLSGLTNEDELNDWKYPEEHRPDYFVDSLGSIPDLVSKIL